jgi:hypothetical protein
VITVDFQELIPESLLQLLGGPQFISAVLDDLAAAARVRWIRLAQTELHSSKRAYIDGIQEVAAEGNTRVIALVGWLANAVERGLDLYDMRDTLLNERAHTSRDGHRYRAIPFRHGTPGSQGQAGAPMGSQYGARSAGSRALSGGMSAGQAAELGKAVYAQAKRLRGRQRLGRRTQVPLGREVELLEGRARQMIQVPLLAAHHTTDIYAGMQRVRKTYARTTQSQYITFRTISDRTLTGWQHPGIEARRLAPRVEQHVQEIVVPTINAAIRAALGKIG